MSAVIGSLRVNLGMETASFTKGAKHAEETLSRLHETLKEYATKFAAAFAFEKIVEGIHGSIEAMDMLGKTAQKMGVPVEELSKLSLAAKLSDTSMETLASSTYKLSKNLELIQGGKGGNAGAALAVLGVKATEANGKLKPTAEIIKDVAEKFHEAQDGANKTAIAIALFGKAGAEMIPFLNQGKEAIKEAADQAKIFGLVVSEEAAQNAQVFDDKLTSLKAAGEGLWNTLANHLIGPLIDVADYFLTLAENGDLAKKLAESLDFELRDMNAILQTTYEAWSAVGTLWNALLDAIDAKNPEARYQIFQAAFSKIREESEKTKKALADFESQKILRGMDLGAIEATHKKTIKHFSEMSDNAGKATKTIGKLAAEAARVFESTRTPLEKYNEELKRLHFLLHNTKMTQETYNRAVSKSFDDYVHAAAGLQNFQKEIEKTNPYLDQLKSSFEGFIDDAVGGTLDLTKGIGDLLKSFEKMALNSVFEQLFSGGSEHPLYGGGGGGGGFLGGIFKNLFGFAEGGTIMPGGSGGIDSQVVAFRKSPNERVDITKPGQTLQSGGSNINVSVNNYASPDLSITATQNSNNNTLEIAIEKKVNDTISSGRANQSMASGFGLRPMRTRR